MSDIRLRVNNRIYGGWTSMRVTRSVETLAGSFELDASNRWGDGGDAWGVAEEDACRVVIDDEVVIDGYIDRRGIRLAGDQRSLSFAGRDRAAQLVDCSAVLESWTFRRVGPEEIVRRLVAPFDIEVSVQQGLALTAPSSFTVSPGESVFEAIDRLVGFTGAVAVSDGRGGLQITRSGAVRAESLREGDNILTASVDYNVTDRFHRYVVTTQIPGSDTSSGGATRVAATAFDEDMRLTSRVLLIRPSGGLNATQARQRGDWEARIRAARAETVSCTVAGWKQSDGALWPINAAINVHLPSLGIDGEMLIVSAYFSLDDAGETTTLRLARPDALTPAPAEGVRKSGARKWWKTLDRDSDGRFRKTAS